LNIGGENMKSRENHTTRVRESRDGNRQNNITKRGTKGSVVGLERSEEVSPGHRGGVLMEDQKGTEQR